MDRVRRLLKTKFSSLTRGLAQAAASTSTSTSAEGEEDHSLPFQSGSNIDSQFSQLMRHIAPDVSLLDEEMVYDIFGEDQDEEDGYEAEEENGLDQGSEFEQDAMDEDTL